MSPLLIFILLFVGIFLLLLEIFLLPGFIVGVLGVIVSIYATVEAYKEFGTTIGTIILTSTVVLNTLVAYFGLKNLNKSPMALRKTNDGRVNEFTGGAFLPGQTGVCITALRPEGKVRFDEEIVTVWSFNGFIDAGETVEIYKIAENKIFVQTKIV